MVNLFKSVVLDGITFGFILSTATGMFFVDRDVLKDNLDHYGLLAVACLFIGALIALILSRFQIETLGQRLFVQKNNLGAQEVRPWYKTIWGFEILFGFLTAFVVSLHLTEFSIVQMFHKDGFEGAVRIFYGLTHPATDVIPSAIVAMMETVFMAFLATALAIPIAFVLSFLSAKNVMGSSSKGLGIYFLLRVTLNLVRSMEPIVWAIIFSVWVGIGPFAGMFALMIHSIASLTKQYSEMVEAVDKGPIEGILSTGAGTLQVLWFAIVPQVILPYVSFTIYRWDINVRMATIVGLVGGGGIGTMLFQYQQQAQWNEVGALILLIAVVVWSMDAASAYIREAVK